MSVTQRNLILEFHMSFTSLLGHQLGFQSINNNNNSFSGLNFLSKHPNNQTCPSNVLI